LSAVIVSGRSIFQVLVPAVANAPVPVLLLERSAVELPLPELEVLLRFAELLEPAVLAPVPAVLAPVPVPLEELLVPKPLVEPVPVLDPLPPAPMADSRTRETVTSGAPWLAGKVTIATPNPFCTPVDDEPLRPEEVEELPLSPLPLDELLELRSVLEDEPIPPDVEELLRSVEDEDDEPIPPLLEDEPERPPLEVVPLVSERRLLLPRLPLVLPLELLEELTGQLLIRAGLETSPCTMVRSLN